MKRIPSITAIAALAALALGPVSSGAVPRAYPRAASTGAYDNYLAPASTCPGTEALTLLSSEQVSAMLCLIDYARAQQGLPTLTRSPLLDASSGLKADDIIRCDDFSHTACGRPVTAPFEQAQYITPDVSWEVGENLAYGSELLGTPRSIMRAWLESDEHRENIFDERWRDQDVTMRKPPALLGITANSIWVSHFGRRESVGAGGAAPSTSATALTLSVRPARAKAGRRTSFRFVVTSVVAGSRRAVRGARIAFASRRAVTDSRGQARIVALLRRPGRYRVVASKRPSRGTAATVRVVRP